jgi:cysteine desulfuration protein SufE
MGQLGRAADRKVTDPAAEAPLDALAREFEHYDRGERSEMLIDYADRFTEVPPEVATRPFAESHRAPRCESDAFVWAVDQPGGTVKLYFAVENPQGLSAKAWAVILDETLSGRPLPEIAGLSGDALFKIFGKDLSMGKGQGLIGMFDLVQHEVKKRMAGRLE